MKFFLTLVLVSFLSVNAVSANEITSANKSIIYYFHGDFRCVSCHKIENYTKEVFAENFTNTMELKVVNVDDNENKHFLNDYQLYTKSVVVSKIKNHQEIAYKNLDKIWQYLGNEEKFKNYLKTEITNFLAE